MYLVYLDESGNSGNNLADPQQPVFLLCAMIVNETEWLNLEHHLAEVVDKHFPWPRHADFEIHGTDLRNRHGPFEAMNVADRIAFRDAWMDVAANHGVKLIYRAIEKRRYQKWQHATFGSGVFVNPHVAAFALLSRVVDDYLRSLPGPPVGMFVSDENKEITSDVEKSIRVLRGTTGTLRLERIIEKGFFINSSQSMPLQLCDLFALSLRKLEESKVGLPAKSIDATGIERAQLLVHRGNERFADVIAWLTEQQQNERKKGATRE
jgi:hypothetical protein